jgi:histidyl-tRNA synthetase
VGAEITESGVLTVKDLHTGQQQPVRLAEISARIPELLRHQ